VRRAVYRLQGMYFLVYHTESFNDVADAAERDADTG
jgi:hypothetical protein